jgi:GH24 family phage-related lysozyme (muramidase)
MKLHGTPAVLAVQTMLGRLLTPIEEHLVRQEGYSTKEYKDTKGIATTGVGQTGEFSDMSFDEVMQAQADKTRRLFPGFDTLPEELQKNIFSSVYRGSLSGSPKTIELFNSGDRAAAADEFLNNDEFRNPKTPQSIKDRMQATADAMRAHPREGPVKLPENAVPNRGAGFPFALPENVRQQTASLANLGQGLPQPMPQPVPTPIAPRVPLTGLELLRSRMPSVEQELTEGQQRAFTSPAAPAREPVQGTDVPLSRFAQSEKFQPNSGLGLSEQLMRYLGFQ